MNLEFRRLNIQSVKAPNFTLSPLELHNFIDFDVKRIYFITNPTGATGSHCHLAEKELFVMISGTCTAVIDQGSGLEEIQLTAPTDALYVGNYVWHHFKDFSEDAILLAVSSTNYNPNRQDYIEDYQKYKEAIAKI